MERRHTATRWPLDVEERRELATTDLAFVRALRELGIAWTPEMLGMDGAARRALASCDQPEYPLFAEGPEFRGEG